MRFGTKLKNIIGRNNESKLAENCAMLLVAGCNNNLELKLEGARGGNTELALHALEVYGLISSEEQPAVHPQQQRARQYRLTEKGAEKGQAFREKFRKKIESRESIAPKNPLRRLQKTVRRGA